MNVHPDPKQFQHAPPRLIDTLSAERALLGRLMLRPEVIAEIAGQITLEDFSHGAHAQIFTSMLRLSDEGKSPSPIALAGIHGDEEIEPNLTYRQYLNDLFAESLHASPVAASDIVEVILDGARREQASSLGSSLSFAAASPGLSLRDTLNDVIEKADDILASFRVGRATSYDMAGAAARALDHLRGEAPGYPTTGLADLDNLLGGWPRGEVSIIAGRPGMGKSAAVSCSVLRAAKAGHACALFSLEMTGVQLGARLLTDLAYTQADPIHYQNIIKRRVFDERHHRKLDWSQEQLDALPVVIEERAAPTLSEIIARTRKIAAEFDRRGQKLEIVFVDHLLLIRPSNRYSGSRNNEVREMVEGLKGLAVELDVAVVALCQLNRGVEGRENKRPGLSDLKESGTIEEIASVIVFLYRPEYYLGRVEDDPDDEAVRVEMLAKCKNQIEYDVAKNRNGAVGHVVAWADIGCNAIRNKSFGAS